MKNQYEFFKSEDGEHFCYGSYAEEEARQFAEDMNCTYKIIVKA